MIDDIHGNLYAPRWYPDEFQRAMARDFLGRRGKPVNEASIKEALCSLNRLLIDQDGSRTVATMDAAGIGTRLVMILDFGIELGEAEASVEQINSEVLEICARSSGRLVGFCGVDPRRPNACALVRQALRDWGGKGLKLHPTGDWSLLDERCLALVSVAADHGAPVLSHLGKTIDVLSDRHASPVDFVELARRFPSCQFVAGHCGFGLWPFFVEHAESMPSNLWFDVGGWQELYGGDVLAQATAIAQLCGVFPGRVAFGTDAPFYGFNMPLIEGRWSALVERAVGGRYVEWDRSDCKLRTRIGATYNP